MSFNRLSRMIVVLGAVLGAGLAQGQGYPAQVD